MAEPHDRLHLAPPSARQHDELGNGAVARQRVALVGAELLGLDDQRVRRERLPDGSSKLGGKRHPLTIVARLGAVRRKARRARRRRSRAPSARWRAGRSRCQAGRCGSIAIPCRRSATTWLTRPIPSFRICTPRARRPATVRTAAVPGRARGACRSTSRSGLRTSSAWSTSRSPTGSSSATEPSVEKTRERPSSAFSIVCRHCDEPGAPLGLHGLELRGRRLRSASAASTTAGSDAQHERRDEEQPAPLVPGLSSAPSASSVAATSADG